MLIAQLSTQRYQVLDTLGQGGMGSVHRALDRLTGQTIALKRVLVAPQNLMFNSRADMAQSEGLLLALAQEFKLLASLRHPHIISVLDYGFDANRQPYFTMELLEQPQTLLAFGRDQPLAHQIDLLIQTLQALAYLHRCGILHCDLKPENILVSQGQVRVLDFGLSRTRDQSRAETSSGTLLYMAPEVLEGAPPTEMADLYAIGVMAYEMLTGRHPFYTDNVSEFFTRVFADAPDVAPLNALSVAGTPLTLAAVVQKLLTQQPALRYQTADAVIIDLCTALGQPPPPESLAIRESFLQAATFVGREQEMAQLTTALAQAVQGQGSAWLIGGESGVGKSRLMDELRTQALVAGALVLRGQAVEGGGLPYQLWRGVLPHLTLTTELSDLESGILQEVLPDIGRMLDRPLPALSPLSGQAGQQRLALTIVDLFKRQPQPTVLILEDLQWSSDSLLPLQHLSRLAPSFPLLILANYRDDERPHLPEVLPDMTRLPLKRLAEGEIAALSQSMLGEMGGHAPLVALLQRETEGNVFFLVEVVRALAEESGGLAQINEKSLPAQVFAGGVQHIIQRRLDKVPAWGQTLLRLAAVAGRQLDLRILDQLQPMAVQPLAQPGLAAWLTVCAEAAVLAIADEQWRFTHDKLRESLLRDHAHPNLHRQVAQAIETVYPGDDAYAEPLTNHWFAAGEAALALPYLLKAVERMVMATTEYTRATEWIERGLACADPQQRSQLLGWRGRVAARQGRYNEAIADYQASLALSATDSVWRVAAFNGLSDVLWRVARLPEARAHAQQALQLARAIGDLLGEASSFIHLGIVTIHTGPYAEARTYFEQSLALCRTLGDRINEARSLRNLGLIATELGENAQAQAYAQACLAIVRAIGDQAGLANDLMNLGNIQTSQAAYPAALAAYQESLAIFEQIGDRQGRCLCLLNLSIALRDMENYPAAAQRLEQALAIAEQSENIMLLTLGIADQGALAYVQGNYAAARCDLEKAFTTFRELGIKHELLEISFRFSLVLLRLGELTAMPSLLVEMSQIALAELSQPARLRALLVAALLWCAKGQYEMSARYLGLIPAQDSAQLRQFDLRPELAEKLQAVLGEDRFADLCTDGQSMDLATVLRQLLAELSP